MIGDRTAIAGIGATDFSKESGRSELQLETDGMSLAEGLAHEQAHYPRQASDYLERIAAFRKG